MCVRLNLVFDIQEHITDVNPKDAGYACVNFIDEKTYSSKIKVRNIRTIQM